MESQQLFVKMALLAWEGQVKRAGNLFETLTDEQLLQEVAPAGNRGIYLLGHLIAVDDAMISLLGLGERLHPELDEAFITQPDKSGIKMPAIKDLRQYWAEVHNRLAELFRTQSPEQWFQRHNAMTDEDFQKEPHRNKLSVLLSRTSHVAYHLGQQVLVKKQSTLEA
ncbi:MAG TPA: DinB family protein [Puia sp.]|jgi:hypothetical protein|nr:DinB family protein [Puia sp.]